MANKYFQQFFFSLVRMATIIQGQFSVGATGAVSATQGNGITSVTRLAVGTYKVLFDDNYNKFLNFKSSIASPNSGSNVAVTAITPGLVYVITVVGTTTTAQWQTAGVPVGVTPAVGVTFLAAATSSGTGQVKVPGASGDYSMELVGDVNTTLAPSLPSGGYLVFQCLGPTDATHTAQIPVDPASGSTVYFAVLLRNSSVKGKGE